MSEINKANAQALLGASSAKHGVWYGGKAYVRTYGKIPNDLVLQFLEADSDLIEQSPTYLQAYIEQCDVVTGLQAKLAAVQCRCDRCGDLTSPEHKEVLGLCKKCIYGTEDNWQCITRLSASEKALKEQAERLVEALRFYADNKNWRRGKKLVPFCNSMRVASEQAGALFDKGSKAREALAAVEGK